MDLLCGPMSEKIRYKVFMSDLVVTNQSLDLNQPKPKRGRPAGQFNYHKSCVLRFLQEYVATNDAPFEGTNEELAAAIGSWGNDAGRIGVSPRQVARYLRKLQDEKTSEGKARIEITLHRHRALQGGFFTKRRIHVNEVQLVQI